MRITHITIMLLVALTLAGCSSRQLNERADTLDRTAAQTEQAADSIDETLARFGPDQVEDSELLAALRSYFPPHWADEFDRAVAAAGDVRSVAADMSTELRAFAGVQRQEASDLRTQAVKAASNAENAVVAGLTVLDLILGGTTTLAGIGVGVYRSIGRKERGRREEAERVTEDVVLSIEASPIMKKAIGDGGNAELRQSMLPTTMKAVRRIKDAA